MKEAKTVNFKAKCMAVLLSLAMVLTAVLVMPITAEAAPAQTVTVHSVTYTNNANGTASATIRFSYSGRAITYIDPMIGLSEGDYSLDLDTKDALNLPSGWSLTKNSDGTYTLVANPLSFTSTQPPGQKPEAGTEIWIGVAVTSEDGYGEAQIPLVVPVEGENKTVTGGDDDTCTHQNYTRRNLNNVEHEVVCSDCGEVIRTENHDQSYIKTRTMHQQTCSCGWTQEGYWAHQKEYDRSTIFGSQHKFTCTVCGYEALEAHEWVTSPLRDSNYCTATCRHCGATYTSPSHKFNKYVEGTNGTHSRICTVCGYQEEESCTYDSYQSAGGGMHRGVCSKCGDVNSELESCSNYMTYTYTSQSRHNQVCGKCKTVYQYNIPCTMVADNSVVDLTNDGMSMKCSDCGHQSYHQHAYGTPQKENYVKPSYIDEGGYDLIRYCRICGDDLLVKHVTLPRTGSSGASSGGKNQDYGAVATAKQGDNTFNDTIGLAIDAEVLTEGLLDIVVDNYFDIVNDDYDVEALVAQNFGEGVDPTSVKISVEPSVSVTPTSWNGSSKVLTVEINASYNLYLEKDGNKVQIAGDQYVPVNDPVHLSLPLPDNFGNDGKKANITHNHGGEIHTYAGEVVKRGGAYFLDFTATYGFSTFTFEATDEDYTGATYFTEDEAKGSNSSGSSTGGSSSTFSAIPQVNGNTTTNSYTKKNGTVVTITTVTNSDGSTKIKVTYERKNGSSKSNVVEKDANGKLKKITVTDTLASGKKTKAVYVPKNGKKIALKKITGDCQKITIPSTIKAADGKKYTVTAIKSNAFAKLEKATTIVVPSTVTSISKKAYDGLSEAVKIIKK